MATEDNSRRRVKTTDTVFEIIDKIQSMNGASLAELAEELDFAKSTIHTHLSSLESNEYIVRTEDEYNIGLKFLYHGMFSKNNFAISRMESSVLKSLAEKTGEVAWIVVEEHGRAVYLNKSMGEKAVQTHASVGGRTHLHHLATGKTILAHLPEERVEKIISQHGLPQKTPHTITDSSELWDELETIRENGIALNDKETVEGLRAIAAPVLDEDTVYGAVCVSGPANRLTTDRCLNKIKPLLLETTNEIELKLQFPSN